MRFKLFDVGHGFCAYVVAGNGNVMVFDCGGDGRRPCDLLWNDGIRGIQHLLITNFDEDHICDLPATTRRLYVQWLHRNGTISPAELRRLKLQGGPISPAMELLLSMLGSYCDTQSRPPPLPGINFRNYYNSYREFAGTNNLSLVTVLDVGGVRFLLPGDLEGPGWRALLRRSDFLTELRSVDAFVASHHGSESGYCEEVFDHCHPRLIILPDSEECGPDAATRRRYERHAGGNVHSTRYSGDWWN